MTLGGGVVASAYVVAIAYVVSTAAVPARHNR